MKIPPLAHSIVDAMAVSGPGNGILGRGKNPKHDGIPEIDLFCHLYVQHCNDNRVLI
jgi:hypothetical protein